MLQNGFERLVDLLKHLHYLVSLLKRGIELVETRYLKNLKKSQSKPTDNADEMKRMHMLWGGGQHGELPSFPSNPLNIVLIPSPKVCLGMALAYMELRRSTAIFFLKLVSLAPHTNDDSMDGIVFFLTSPRSGKCDIVIKSE
jgi:hypothetical protein